MDITFYKSQLKSFQNILTKYNTAGYSKIDEGNKITYKYLSPATEEYGSIRTLQAEGVEVEGFPAYILLSAADYTANDVPVGVSHSEILDVDGIGTGVQKKWNEWNSPVMERNDNTQVIIPTTYQSQAATPQDFLLFELDADPIEIFGLVILQGTYQNDPLWLVDEFNVQLVEAPIEKTAGYYTVNWEAETFDFLHATKLVANWFNGLVGASITDKFNSQSIEEQVEIIRWGVLPHTAEGSGLIEATIPSNKRLNLRLWNSRRGYNARQIRFEAAWIYLIDNFKVGAIEAKMDVMLSSGMRDYYLHEGQSASTQHLMVNSQINVAFWAQFIPSDLVYSDRTLGELKSNLELILGTNEYPVPLIF